MTSFLILVNDRSGRGRAMVTAQIIKRLIQDADLGDVLGIVACQARSQWQPLLSHGSDTIVIVCGPEKPTSCFLPEKGPHQERLNEKSLPPPPFPVL